MARPAGAGLTIWTYDWVPEGPRGFVRDMRLRWACEEAGLDHAVRSVPFADRGPWHLARQPFGQVPFLTDGDVTLFESGACLIHLAEKSEALMPRNAKVRAETLSWILAALNSVEAWTMPWWFIGLSDPAENPLDDLVRQRLGSMEAVFAARDWLAGGRFTAADLLMADVLRLPWVRAFGSYPATEAYCARAAGRPAFVKAVAAQMAHFETGDTKREKEEDDG